MCLSMISKTVLLQNNNYVFRVDLICSLIKNLKFAGVTEYCGTGKGSIRNHIHVGSHSSLTTDPFVRHL